MFKSLKGILKNVGLLSSDCSNDSQIDSNFKTKHNEPETSGLSPNLSNQSPSSTLTSSNCHSTKNSEMILKSKTSEEPVILTLSSDEDEDDDGKSNASFQKSYKSSLGEEISAQISSSDQPLPLHNKEPIVTEDFNNDIYERRHAKQFGTYLDKENLSDNSNYRTHTLHIQCRSIRIGSYQVTPTDKVAINAAGMQMKVQPFTRGENEPVLLTIKIKKILKILASFESSRHTEQVIFLYLTPCIAEDIRSKLKMFDKKFFYFDPCSNEQSHRRITLFPDKMKADSVFLLKNILNFEMLDMTKHCKLYDLLEDLSYKEANDILTKSSTCEGYLSQSLPQETVTLFIYPPPPSKGGITITTADYQCLSEDTFLNDVLIDFHLKWMLLEKLSTKYSERTHIMSSFFYKRLTAKPKKDRLSHPVENAPNLSAARKRHNRVKSWTKSVDIFDKDFILIPINERSHWFLVVICFPGLNGPTKIVDGQLLPGSIATEPTRRSSRSRKSCEMIPIDDDDEFSDRDEAEGDDGELDDYFEDSEEPISKKQKLSDERHFIKQPCIIIFDSLSTRNRSKIVATLREYLAVEYFTKKMEVKEFNKMTMPGACPKVPQQRNFSDCGIFVMQYAESFFENPIIDFTLPICSLANWFGQDVMQRKRESIANLLKELLSLYNPSRLCDLPPITFPSHIDVNAETTETLQMDQENHADAADADSTTFSAVDSFSSSTQEGPMRRKININISRRSSNLEPTSQSDNESLVNSLVSASNSIISSTPTENEALCIINNSTANERSFVASSCAASSLSSQKSCLLSDSDKPSINSVKAFPKFGKPDYILHFEKLETNKNTGLQQIISNYDNFDDDSDDEIFVSSKKKKSISALQNKLTEPSVETTKVLSSVCKNSTSAVEIVEIEELTNIESDNESEDVYANLNISNFDESPRTDNQNDLYSP